MAKPKEPAAVAKTTLYLRADLYKKARMLALSEDKTFTDLINEALAEYLKRK